MLITKFNRMIRNRVLWAGIAVIVALVFILGSSRWSGGCDRQQGEGVGEIYGERVTSHEFALSRFFAMGLRDIPDLTPELSQRLQDYTWRRIASLRTAARMGISAGDDEIREELQRDPSFQVNGAFHPQKYRSVLDSQRLRPQLYESYLRQELILRKLSTVLQAAVWAPQGELARRISNLTDSITAEYTILDRTGAEAPDVTEEDARSFYDKNTELFAVPPEVNVRFVSFPVSNYVAQIELADTDVAQYYTNHIDDYSQTDTNGVSTPIPFEDVKDGIAELLTNREAQLAARSDATDFSIALAPDRFGKSRDLADVVADRQLVLQTSEFFSVSGNVPGLSVGPSFNREAFGLDPSDPETYFSDAVLDDDAVYVLLANESRDGYVPAFTGIVDRVTPLAATNAMQAAFFAEAQEIKEAVQAALGEGKSFAMALEAHDLGVVTTVTFVAQEATPEDIDHFYSLVPAAMALEVGELSDVLEVEEGAILAHVTRRDLGDAVSGQLLKPRVAESMDRYLGGLLFQDWADHMLTKGNFRDLRPKRPSEPAQDEDSAPTS